MKIYRFYCYISHRVDDFLHHRDNVVFWLDHLYIHELEHEFAVSSDEDRDEARRTLSHALVMSFNPDDVRCGITILQDSLLRVSTPKLKRKLLYQLAVGYFRSGNYSKSLEYIARCLEIKPGCTSAIILGLLVTDRVNKEKGYNIVITSAKLVGFVTGLIGSTTLFLYHTWVIEALTYKFLTKDYVKKVATPLRDTSNPLQMKEVLYLLAHRYFTRANFEDLSRGSYLIDRCLEIAPEWKPAVTLKRRIKYASVKAYIGERVLMGISSIVGFFGPIAVLSWAFD